MAGGELWAIALPGVPLIIPWEGRLWCRLSSILGLHIPLVKQTLQGKEAKGGLWCGREQACV